MRDIDNKTALVTGGGSGIGRSLALALADAGARVVVADILLDNARAVAETIEARGGRAAPVHCDVSDRSSVQRMKALANDAFGRVGLLFPNAGATALRRLTDMPESDVDWIIHVNLHGVVNCLSAFLPDMLAAREGHIVATASAAGLMPALIPYHAPYSAAKAGVIGLMLNLRRELAEFDVGATVLCPSGVETGMKDHNERYRPDRFGGPSEKPLEVAASLSQYDDFKYRSPDEVAQLVLRAVRDNRPIVVTDALQRRTFIEGYVDVVLRAFDDLEAFDAEIVPP